MGAYQKHKREALQSLTIERASDLFRGTNEGGGDVYVRSEI